MGKVYAATEIQEVGVQLMPGNYLFQITELDDSERTSNGNYQIVATLSVVEPSDFAGSPFKDWFVVGTPEDPEADEQETWKKSYAAGRYKQLLNKAGVELSGDVEADIAQATGQQVGGQVIQEMQADTLRDGSPNPRAKQMRSRIAMFWRPGERQTGVMAAAGNGAATAAAPKPTAAPPAAKPVAKPVAAKPAPVAPAKPAPAAKLPLAKAPTAVPKKQMLDCPICQQKVDRAEFAAHVEAHNSGVGEEE